MRWRLPSSDFVAEHRSRLDSFASIALSSSVASFDLFDTLLVRSYGRPSDLFDVLGRSLVEAHPVVTQGFRERRVAAEAAARDDARRSGRHEITLAEIYERMAASIPAVAGIAWDAVMGAECDLEVGCVSTDPQVLAVFYALHARMPCILVSDMYLPAGCIRAMLDRCGIGRDVSLFLSCELDATKHDGSIWDVVRSSLALVPGDRIAHLDDNPVVASVVAGRADVVVTPLVPPADRRPIGLGRPLGSGLLHDACLALLAQDLARHRDDPGVDPYWLAVAHLVAVPAALGMAGFVRRFLLERGTDRVFFLARDGLVIRRAYEAAWADPRDRPSGYVWASRRCLNVAMIDAIGDAEASFLCSGSSRIAVADYLRRIDLDPSDPAIASVVASSFSSAGHVVASEADRLLLRGMFAALESQVRTRAALERGALLRHLRDVGLFDSPGVVVDLGWHCSLQRSLIEIGSRFAGGADIDGAYLGLFPSRHREAAGLPMVARGWLFDGDSAATEVVRRSVDVVELLFSAPEGGVRYVDMLDGVAYPVRIHEDEEAPRLAVSSLVHDVVGRSATALRGLVRSLTPEELRSSALDALEGFLSAPAARDVQAFRRVPHAEGFGVAKYRPLIPPIPRGEGRWAIDRACNEASWRAAFIAGMDPVSRLRMSLVLWERKARRMLRG